MFKGISELKKQWLLLAAMLYVAFVLLMHKWGHQGDMMFWMDWSKYIYNNGFTHVYDNPSCNYLPAYLYFLVFHVKLQGNLTDIQDNLYTIKYYTFIFDMLGAYLAVWFVKDDVKKIFYFLILLFNVAYIYNTAFWTQVDAIFTFFGFASLILALEKKSVLSVLFLLIALNFKLQALVFIPVVGLVLMPQFLNKNGIKKIILSVILIAIVQVTILLPFILTNRLHQVIHVITDSVGHYPYPTVGAFNLWSLLLPDVGIEEMYHINDGTKFWFISYKQFGNLLFFISIVIAVFPLMKYLYQKYVKQNELQFDISKIFLMSSLVALSFYYFNTEMHERYAHPAIISLAAYAFCSKRFLVFILGSVAYFLNLERICWYLNLHNETYEHLFVFQPKFVSVLYLSLISILFIELYRKSMKDVDLISI